MSKRFISLKPADLLWRGNQPYSKDYDDIYYSLADGVEQTRFVFVDGNDLIERWSALDKEQHSVFTIAETGFGTGLNFLYTVHLWQRYAPHNAMLHFISCEKNPFKKIDLYRALSNWPELQAVVDELLIQYPPLTPGTHQLHFCQGRAKLTLMLGDCYDCYEQLLYCGDSLVEEELRTSFINAWYFDGFAPKKNERMWSKSLFQIIAMLSKEGTTFATYSAASEVKIGLQECGFTINKKKGYGPKRHMLVGYFNKREAYHIKQRETPWYTGKKIRHQSKSVLILGAGLAGCFMANSLAKRGWHSTLIDEHDGVGLGASANQGAVLFPRLSAFHSPLTELMLCAFLYAYRIYRALLIDHPIGALDGALLLPYNVTEKAAQDNLRDWLTLYPELGILVSQQEASLLAGINIARDGLYIPYSGWINSPLLCDYLIQQDAISLIHNTHVDRLCYEDNQWWVGAHHASVLVLANGHRLSQFEETNHLPIKPIRGQMSKNISTSQTKHLKIPLCAEAHVLPSVDAMHWFGATYELGEAHAKCSTKDDSINLHHLAQISPGILWSNHVVDHWSGVRAATPDYLPLVGPIAKKESFVSLYSKFASNSKRWIPHDAPCHPNLYAFAGFGSRGLTTIPLAAEWLSATINNELSGAPRRLLQAISPGRFLKRTLDRG